MNIQPNHPVTSIAGSLRTGAKDASDSTETNSTQKSRAEISVKDKEAKTSISEGDQTEQRDADGRQLAGRSKPAASDDKEQSGDVNELDSNQRPVVSQTTKSSQRLDYRV